MRAADVARELGIPANQASFHLRQLAKYGLVEEAPEEARDRRDRVWRVADERGVPGQPARARGVAGRQGGGRRCSVRTAIAKGYRTIERAYATDGAEAALPHGDRRVAAAHQGRGRASWPASSTTLIQRWGDRTRGGRGEGRRTYLVFQVLQPRPGGRRRGGPAAASEES